ncbi:hypothetical protein KM176_05715 [Pseudooceanicola sp. CBS1P-1]|uniref:Cytochrome c domain-containing protein n=1 Tax=Pseudooceanicola albus TaxID=2692189 RepID=A0A6L7FYX8_9RHOB|nr:MULTISPECIES: c-type cytochrome domain-containing protein [Pseudooceanicola]MBT9383350.1 hypothetical protein [Pseudooceanicola endophyticus]MXN16327.1 hypothetical protein [Pseudooceanicola albus]
MRPALLAPALAALSTGALAAEEAAPAGWAEVSAIFTARCVMCHSELAGASKGLRLDDYAAALAGGERGAVLIPGAPARSELMLRLRGTHQPRMPFLGRPLPDAEIALIEGWIAAGLPEFPRHEEAGLPP